jgi:hypothetical protein
MQIHEITLREAEWQPLDPKKIMATARPTKLDLGPKIPTRVGTEPAVDPAAFKAKDDALSAKQAQYQQQSNDALKAMKANTVAFAPKTPTPATTQPTAGAGAFGQMAQQLAPPPGPTQTSTGGTATPTSQGLTHTSAATNPNVIAQHPETQKAQQQWDIVNQQLRKQSPGQTDQYYQQAMLKKMGYARPGVFRPTTTTKAPTPRPAPATKAPTPRPAPATKAPTPRPAPAANAAATINPTQYPPITLGTGPKAQTYVNKGRGYVDSKTNKPMPPAIVKAMGLK